MEDTSQTYGNRLGEHKRGHFSIPKGSVCLLSPSREFSASDYLCLIDTLTHTLAFYFLQLLFWKTLASLIYTLSCQAPEGLQSSDP